MISKSKIKLIRSLELKKYRTLHGLFVAEGGKLVSDLLSSFACEWLAATPSWLETHGPQLPPRLLVDETDTDGLRAASLLKNPQDVLALFRLPTADPPPANPERELVLMLDGIQDPGNLGTIVRLADWFGIEHIVCSPDTADIFGPKTVQATMGAMARVSVSYLDPVVFLRACRAPKYGTVLDGVDLYAAPLSSTGVVVLGNEGNGIRPSTASLLDHRLSIPPFPAGRTTSESLNVATAAAIICAEFRRRSC